MFKMHNLLNKTTKLTKKKIKNKYEKYHLEKYY